MYSAELAICDDEWLARCSSSEQVIWLFTCASYHMCINIARLEGIRRDGDDDGGKGKINSFLYNCMCSGFKYGANIEKISSI